MSGRKAHQRPKDSTRPSELAADERHIAAYKHRVVDKWKLTQIMEALGYGSLQAVRYAIAAGAKKVLPLLEIKDAVEAELATLDVLEDAVYADAAAGNQAAMAMIVDHIMVRRARLLGLDAPQRLANADGSNLPAPTNVVFYLPSNGRDPEAKLEGSEGGDSPAAGAAGAVPQ